MNFSTTVENYAADARAESAEFRAPVKTRQWRDNFLKNPILVRVQMRFGDGK